MRRSDLRIALPANIERLALSGFLSVEVVNEDRLDTLVRVQFDRVDSYRGISQSPVVR